MPLLEIKNILCDVIDYCYPDCEMLIQYKKFYIEICDKTMKTRHGDYNMKNHHIRIFNLYRSDAKIVATTIHELAHHVDWCNRGTTGHGKDFYLVYKQLLYTALNMGILNPDEFLDSIGDASDFGKVRAMIEDYIPEHVDYNEDYKKIICRNCYEQKDLLKKRDYTYNSINKAWEKVLPDTDEETAYLDSIGVEYEIVKYGQISFDKKKTIIAAEGSYEYRQELKEAGFRYVPKKRRWELEVDEDEYSRVYHDMIKKFPEVNIIRQ